MIRQNMTRERITKKHAAFLHLQNIVFDATTTAVALHVFHEQ